MLDLVVDRREMKATIARLLRFMLDVAPAPAPPSPPATTTSEITEPNPVGA
jgi:hypothetical protein